MSQLLEIFNSGNKSLEFHDEKLYSTFGRINIVQTSAHKEENYLQFQKDPLT
jgi:hypothetical protein